MRVVLEFREHGLPEKGCANHIEIIVEKVFFQRRVFCVVQHEFEKQNFVYGTCDLRHEKRVRAFRYGLVFVGEIGMKRVTHFVRDGEYIVRGGLIVQKRVRVNAVAARAVRAARLSVRFLNVNPSLVVALFQKRLIIFAEGRKAFNDILVCVVEVKLHFRARNERGIHIVEIKLVIAEKLLSVGNVSVQRRQARIDRRQEIVVNLSVDVLVEKRAFQARIVFVRLAHKHVLFDVAEIGRRNRVYQGRIRAVIFLVSFLSLLSVFRMKNNAVHAVAELCLCALPLDFWQRQFEVVNHIEDI